MLAGRRRRQIPVDEGQQSGKGFGVERDDEGFEHLHGGGGGMGIYPRR